MSQENARYKAYSDDQTHALCKSFHQKNQKSRTEDKAILVEDIDDDKQWISKPHTLFYGFLFFVWITVHAFSQNEKASLDQSTIIDDLKSGIQAACYFFLVYCMLQLPDGHFIRPHPMVWRLITGIFLLYEMFLLVILFLRTADARNLLKYMDPSLGNQLPETSYATDCRIYTPENPESMFYNLENTLFDHFVIMHFVGWFIGALMVRSYIICWTLSILFELYEMTFQHWLANFNECWWDHLILDILICNALGIYLGMKVCRQLEMKKYNWVGIRNVLDFKGKAKRAIAQFTPMYWLPYDWKIFRCAGRFWRVMVMVIIISVMMLNSFFLKSVLWIPTSNKLNIIRLCIWYSAGSYGVAEYYIFTTMTRRYQGHQENSMGKLGPRAWLAVAVVATEVCVIVKHGKGMFHAPFPLAVKVGWSLAVIAIGVGSVIYFHLLKGLQSKDERKSE